MEEKDEEEQTQMLFYLQNNTNVIKRHHTQDILLTFQTALCLFDLRGIQLLQIGIIF